MKYPYWAHYHDPVAISDSDLAILIFLCTVMFCLAYLSRG